MKSEIMDEIERGIPNFLESIELLTLRYNIGNILEEPKKLSGGSLHDMWWISTSTGQYALKKVNEKNWNFLVKTILPVSRAEYLAFHHQERGLATRVALRSTQDKLIERCQRDNAWMIFPWVEGNIKKPAQITASDAQSVAKLLMEVQRSSPEFQGLVIPDWFGFSQQHWASLIREAEEKALIWASLARSHESVFNQWSTLASRAAFSLQKNLIVSHRDLSYSNVIWSPENIPVVIDWEYAGLINPESEIFNTAMTWSFTGAGCFDSDLIETFIDATNRVFTLERTTLMAGYAGYLLEWCEFNMRRSLEANVSIEIAETQVKSTIQVLSKLLQTHFS